MGCSSSRSRSDGSAEQREKLKSDRSRSFETTPDCSLEDSASPRGPMGIQRMNSMNSVSSMRSLSQVAAGHGGASILKFVDRDAEEVPDQPDLIMKVYDEREASVYREIAASNDILQPFIATFYGEVDAKDIPEDLPGSRYMKLTNLLRKFGSDVHVMDCKLGVRSFVEEEAQNTKLREDLYIKMKMLDPSAPTDEEHAQESCTKYRWMSYNDSVTTTTSLGFRVDGITNSERSTPKKLLKQLKNLSDISLRVAEDFLGDHDDRASAATAVLQRLQELRDAMTTSDFVRRHSFVGASLLFIAEGSGPHAGVYVIDFAKTLPLPEGVVIDHRSPWVPGNHEDGLLYGLDNMILLWEEVKAYLLPGSSLGSPALPRTFSPVSN